MSELRITWNSSMKFQRVTKNNEIISIENISEDEYSEILCQYLLGNYELNDDWGYITLDNGKRFQFYFGSVGGEETSNVQASIIQYDDRTSV